MTKFAATYRRVSKKEQARNKRAFEAQGWELDEAVVDLGIEPDRLLRFEDVQTGKTDDRPQFLALLEAIKADKIDILIVSRIDRLSRDLESNARFQKLIEIKKVRIYEIAKGDYLDFSRSKDWSYYSNAGLRAEEEVRELSYRIKRTFRLQRSQGKMAGGKVGFPYRRSSSGTIEPDPNNWELAIECIKIIIECQGSTENAIVKIRELGLNRSMSWLSSWIRSPLIRGHTPIGTYEIDSNGKSRRKKQADIELFRDTHPSLFADPRLVGCEREIDRVIAESTCYKGAARNRKLHSLAGLIYCARCSGVCHISGHSSPDDRYLYAICAERTSRRSACGGNFGVNYGRGNEINTKYSDIELAVLVEIANKSAELIDLAFKSESIERVESPEISKLRAAIEKLKQMNDPDLDGAIAAKSTQLNRLILAEPDNDSLADMRDRFIKTFADGEAILLLDESQKRTLYREWIERIEVDRSDIRVRLKA